MRVRTRPLWIILGCFAILLAVGVTTFAVNAYRAGMLVIRIQEAGPHGMDLAIQIPAILVPMALQFVPDEALNQVAHRTADWGPAVRAATKAFSESPDFLLVQVDSPGEQVRISKERGRLIVDVSSIEERLHISLPLRILGPVIKQLEGAVSNS